MVRFFLVKMIASSQGEYQLQNQLLRVFNDGSRAWNSLWHKGLCKAYPRRVGKYLATRPSQKIFGGFLQTFEATKQLWNIGVSASPAD